MNPLINGVNYSFADIKAVLFGIPLIGITGIDYERSQEKTNNYGAGSEPVSRSYNKITYSGSLTIFKDEWQAIINAAPGKDPLLIPMFPIQVIFANTRITNTPTRHNLSNVEFLTDKLSAKENDGRILLTIPFIFAGLTNV